VRVCDNDLRGGRCFADWRAGGRNGGKGYLTRTFAARHARPVCSPCVRLSSSPLWCVGFLASLRSVVVTINFRGAKGQRGERETDKLLSLTI